jgi:outer membrane protein OmpA-like peptidoglycan-associated protein
LVVPLAFVAALCSAGTAHAQASFDAELFRPSPHGESYFAAESAAIADTPDLRAGIWGIYAFRPLQAYDTSGRVVQGFLDHRVDGAFTTSFAFLHHVSLGLVVPFTLFQAGNVTDLFPAGQALAHVAFGDMRVEAKGFLLNEKQHYLDLALLAFLTVPSGYEKGFAGDRWFTGGGELDLGRSVSLFRFALNFGAMYRQTTTLLDLTIGPELYYRLGLGFDFGKISKAPLELIAEITGRTALLTPFRDVQLSPAEWAVGLKYKPVKWLEMNVGGGRALIPGYGAPAARAFLGLVFIPISPLVYEPAPASTPAAPADDDHDGIWNNVDKCPTVPEDKDGFEDGDGCPDPDNDRDGIPDEKDKCPNEPEDWDNFEDDDGCPDPDNDKDGILDNVDKCPDQAEDKDGFEDDDGCPDPDNDSDGILDAADKCPNEPETLNDVDDFDGCPDAAKVVQLVALETEQIRIDDQVHFKLGKAIIDKKSFGLLNQVAHLITNHQEIAKVRVEGHTDELGSDKLNMTLSQKRAEAVVAYLIKRAGVPSARLEAVGYGKTRPIATNRTSKGRGANRRVAFVIVTPDAPASEPAKR